MARFQDDHAGSRIGNLVTGQAIFPEWRVQVYPSLGYIRLSQRLVRHLLETWIQGLCLSKTEPRTKLNVAACWLLLVSWSGICSADEQAGQAEPEESSKIAEFQSTHKQARIIRPMLEDRSIALNTFCLDHSGKILACVGGSDVQYLVNNDGSQQGKTVELPQRLQCYSPDGALIRSADLSFKPTAVNVAPNGMIFVAGGGKIAKVDSEGHVVATADSPHIGSMEDFKQRIDAAAKKQREENSNRYREQVTRIEERIKALNETPEADRSELDTRRRTTYQQQKKLYESQIEAVENPAHRQDQLKR